MPQAEKLPPQSELAPDAWDGELSDEMKERVWERMKNGPWRCCIVGGKCVAPDRCQKVERSVEMSREEQLFFQACDLTVERDALKESHAALLREVLALRRVVEAARGFLAYSQRARQSTPDPEEWYIESEHVARVLKAYAAALADPELPADARKDAVIEAAKAVIEAWDIAWGPKLNESVRFDAMMAAVNDLRACLNDSRESTFQVADADEMECCLGLTPEECAFPGRQCSGLRAPVSGEREGETIRCVSCGKTALLPYTDATARAVSIEPARDWTAPPPRCPECSAAAPTSEGGPE